MYMVNPALPAAIKRAFGPHLPLLENKYYMDRFNENVFSRGTRLLGTGLWNGGDQGLIDGAIVDGSWKRSAASRASCAGCSRATSTTTRSRCCWASSSS